MPAFDTRDKLGSDCEQADERRLSPELIAVLSMCVSFPIPSKEIEDEKLGI